MNNGDLQKLTLLIDSYDKGEQLIGKAASQIRKGISKLEIGEINEIPTNEVQQGARSADAFTLGALALVIAPAYGTELIKFLLEWFRNRKDTRIKIRLKRKDKEIEIDYNRATASDEEMKRITKEFSSLIASE